MVPIHEPVKVKLYGNRRLYQPARGRYVTLDQLAALTRQGVEVIVRDAQSGADVTDLVLRRSPTRH
ncbi:MAG TPA: polyhydroxyalkanoate synthesis regulator DNA-binding domain-containing protein [Xanthobacteraceae bacterium]|nr:polyhydroxyalkanoate synthesis regulator DNA-binding domain-containing protein [Xanthobacteraceae bacterium]